MTRQQIEQYLVQINNLQPAMAASHAPVIEIMGGDTQRIAQYLEHSVGLSKADATTHAGVLAGYNPPALPPVVVSPLTPVPGTPPAASSPTPGNNPWRTGILIALAILAGLVLVYSAVMLTVNSVRQPTTDELVSVARAVKQEVIEQAVATRQALADADAANERRAKAAIAAVRSHERLSRARDAKRQAELTEFMDGIAKSAEVQALLGKVDGLGTKLDEGFRVEVTRR